MDALSLAQNRPDPGLLTLIETLVGFDTTSRESNMALIDFVRDQLHDLDIPYELDFDKGGGKANLFATIGPNVSGGLVLSGHSDVVPVDGQNWTSDPFKVVERDGRLIGRGVADMKSFIALALHNAAKFVALPLDKPVHLALTYDEEIGCIGAGHLVKLLAGRAIKPATCIIGEPTLMRPVIGHKGRMSFRAHVHGRESHSAMTHEGVNAIEAAAALVVKLRAMARRFRDEGPFDPDLTPPYTTIQTGRIAGGTAVNIVPRECHFDGEFRFIPGQHGEDLLAEINAYAEDHLHPEMHEIDPDTGIRFEVTSNVAGLSTSRDAEIVKLVQQLTGANGTTKVSFGTEGGLYQSAGIETIICGPGSIDQAHKPDEWIDLDQIRQGELFMDRLVERLEARALAD